ncbi:HD domain-containing phosphohydrolase [Frigoriglobus tundricola]|uniref:HD-GYP domain-containing protein n=1 Tax=Frigoriglobus tundricola TaxID=2774151 RepID=A0A6M5Z5C8_9BACT|nr:HD domain-containing phosphohydrolase [Frigoriglobus tundricola]QJX00905.1 hypothetical protein FTUN_8543 [Frigoriglobus tundricola]
MSSPHTPRIVLSLANAPAVRTWSSSCHLRIGRLPELEVVLDDPSVSRLHAEVLLNEEGWVVRDRGSSNGTARNGVRIGRTPQPVSPGDTIRVGTVVLRVDDVQVRPGTVRVGAQTIRVEAAAQRAWADSADHEEPAPSGSWRDQKALLRLLRAGHRLAQAAQVGDPLRQLLDEVVTLFGARRGAVFLADEAAGQLTVRCFVGRSGGAKVRPPGKTLAALALRDRRSLLFKDRTAAARHLADSALRGEMHSVVCAVLRGPDRDLGVLHLDRGPDAAPFTEADLHRADALAAAVALGLDRQQLVERHEALFLQTVTALAQAVEMRDASVGNHTQRVTAYALLLAEELGLDEDVRRHLRVATLLHDIGKIAIDDQILRKPGRLSDHESDQVKTHVTRGAEIVQMIPGLEWALPVVRGHHERWDGRGYPDGLAGEDIPLTARVVAVADAFGALTADRAHHKGAPAPRAFAELQAGAGTHFDPECVAAFLRVRTQVEALLEKETVEQRALESGCDTVSNRDLDRARAKPRRTKPPAPAEGLPARGETDPTSPLSD